MVSEGSMDRKKTKVGLFYISDVFNYQHISKSFVNIPRHIQKNLVNITCEVNYFSEKDYDDDVLRNIGRSKLFNFKFFRFLFSTIIMVREKYDVQMMLHLNFYTFLMVLLSKIFNPTGRIYLKLDVSSEFFKQDFDWFRSKYIEFIISKADLISYESLLVREMIHNSSFFSGGTHKVIYLPNCSVGISQATLSFDDKKKIMITVGRLGTYQKNIELIVDSLKKVNLRDWTFYFVGPADPTTISKIESVNKFNVSYVGEITCRYELLNLYRKSSVFVLSSRYEGFATVLAEAAKSGSYIVSTDVNGARDTTDNFSLGSVFNSDKSLCDILDNIINESIPYTDLANKAMIRADEIYNWDYQIMNSGISNFFESKPKGL